MTLKKEYAFFSFLQQKIYWISEHIRNIKISNMYINYTEGNQGSKKFSCIKKVDIIVACPRLIEDIKRGRETFCNF